MKKFSYLKNVVSLKYDRELCVGCGRCIEVCPHAVFVLENKRSYIIDINSCMECGACAINCPTAALTVESGMGCASGLVNEWLMEKGLKRGGRSSC